MRIAILAKPDDPRATNATQQVAAWLAERGHELLVYEGAEGTRGLGRALSRDALAAEAELAVVLGGDGTQLHAARLFSTHEVPIFGVNLGRLGFLTDTGPESMLSVLEQVLARETIVQQRLMLEGEVYRAGQRAIGPFLALNDIVVNKAALAQVVRLETHVGGNFVSSYLADGIIFATPTGSTAYGLAVGGPIIEPSTSVILVAPICPHMLTNRPLIVSADSVLECSLVESRGEVFLTIDGQEGFPLQSGDRIRVRRASHQAILIRAQSVDFYDTLRTKMGWGSG